MTLFDIKGFKEYPERERRKQAWLEKQRELRLQQPIFNIPKILKDIEGDVSENEKL